jgi:hypothetical protein
MAASENPVPMPDLGFVVEHLGNLTTAQLQACAKMLNVPVVDDRKALETAIKDHLLADTPITWADYPAGFQADVWKKDIPKPAERAVMVDITIAGKKLRLMADTKSDKMVLMEHVPALHKATVEWTPTKTNLRDFEFVSPGTPAQFTVARAAGVGVLILEAADLYVKFALDKDAKLGVKFLTTGWRHDDDYKRMLDSDLWLGYEVLYVAGDRYQTQYAMHHKREPISPREGTVFLPGLPASLGVPAQGAAAVPAKKH